jgi:hypothetical protein
MCIGNTAKKLIKPGKIRGPLSKYEALTQRMQQVGNMYNGGVADIRPSVGTFYSVTIDLLYKIWFFKYPPKDSGLI